MNLASRFIIALKALRQLGVEQVRLICDLPAWAI